MKRINLIQSLSMIVVIMLTVITMIIPASAAVVPNTATGDIAGAAADLDTTQSTFTVDITTLALVKAAFLTDGTQLTDGDKVAKGTMIQFLLYVDNSTNALVDSVNAVDILNAAFAYQTGSIITDATTVSSGVWTEQDLYDTITGSGTPRTDLVSGLDIAGSAAGTVSAGDGAGNAVLSIAADRVWGMVFTVKTQ